MTDKVMSGAEWPPSGRQKTPSPPERSPSDDDQSPAAAGTRAPRAAATGENAPEVGAGAPSIRFNIGIPRGNDGLQGSAERPGPTGPAFTNFTVDSVTTLQPFQPATVVATFEGTFVRFAFGIPQGQAGQQGNNGLDGQPGQQGPQGPQGPPGEVTSQLAAAIATTANNTDPIATLDIPISDPPAQSEVHQMLAKMNALIVALRRPIP